jgi:hypothetical protein
MTQLPAGGPGVSSNYLRMLAVLAAPVANARGDGPTENPPLDVWRE